MARRVLAGTSFDPRPCARGDRDVVDIDAGWIVVSIHAPVRGATARVSRRVNKRREGTPLPALLNRMILNNKMILRWGPDQRRPGPHLPAKLFCSVSLLCRQRMGSCIGAYSQPDMRRAARQDRSKPLVAALEAYMREHYERLSAKNEVAKAIRYMLVRWASFTRFLDDGPICLSNNAAERALRGVALGRRNWTFAGSDEGGRRAAAIYSLITTCLCRERHRAVYADRRTMPSGPVFPRIPRDRHVIGSA